MAIKNIIYDLYVTLWFWMRHMFSSYCATTADGSVHYKQHIHDYTRQNVLTVSQDKLISWHLAILEIQVRYQLLHFDFRKSIVSVVAHSREMRLAERGRVSIINLHHWQVADDSKRTVTSHEKQSLLSQADTSRSKMKFLCRVWYYKNIDILLGGSY